MSEEDTDWSLVPHEKGKKNLWILGPNVEITIDFDDVDQDRVMDVAHWIVDRLNQSPPMPMNITPGW